MSIAASQEIDWKPLPFDVAEIRSQCVEMFNVVAATHTFQFLDADTKQPAHFPSLARYSYEALETQLFKRLLSLAVHVRTFDDHLSRSEVAGLYNTYKAEIEHSSLGEYDHVDQEVKSVRVCCNKIIHAIDIRADFDTADGRRPMEPAPMTGDIWIEGENRGRDELFVLDVLAFLDQVIRLTQFHKARLG